MFPIQTLLNVKSISGNSLISHIYIIVLGILSLNISDRKIPVDSIIDLYKTRSAPTIFLLTLMLILPLLIIDISIS